MSLALLDRWDTRQRLSNLVTRVQNVGHVDEELLSVSAYHGVTRRSEAKEGVRAAATDLTKYQLVEPGDLVFNRLSTWQGAFGMSRHRGIVSPAYLVLRAKGVEPGYVDHLLHSGPYIAELRRLSKWMPPAQFDILWEDLRSVEIPLPSTEDQRRIADFLDDRVTRIDQIITARRDQRALVQSWLTSAYDETLVDFPRVPMRHLLKGIGVGIVIQPARLYTEEADGVPALRGLNIREGTFSLEDVVRISAAGHAENRRSALRAGDLVVVRTGDAGTAAVVPASMAGWNCIDLVLARPKDDVVSHLLAFTLNAAKRSLRLTAESSGSIQQHLGANALAAVTVHFPDIADQTPVLRRLEEARAMADEMDARVQRSIALLSEYKQSLITAAVSGELDVATASSGIPG